MLFVLIAFAMYCPKKIAKKTITFAPLNQFSNILLPYKLSSSLRQLVRQKTFQSFFLVSYQKGDSVSPFCLLFVASLSVSCYVCDPLSELHKVIVDISLFFLVASGS